MKLIDDWKQAWKLKSVQVGAASAFFYALILLSEQFLSVWNVIPQELKNKIPESIGEYVCWRCDGACALEKAAGTAWR